MNEELKAEVSIPFINSEHAKIAFNTLVVDEEPRKELISKTLHLNDNILTVIWTTKQAKLLRVSVGSFLDHIDSVLETIVLFEQ